MNWILFILFLIISAGLILFGVSEKKWAIAFAGALFLLVMGIAILGTGLDIPAGVLIG